MQRQSVRDLPANKTPVGTRCITLEIPDDDEWEQHAYSELYRLALWMLWARNAGHDGAPVAKRWRKALDTWRHCDGSPSPVILDGDFDMSELCELLRWHNGILQGWCCGEWTDIPTDGTAPIPGDNTQPSSGSRPGPGESICFTRSMSARDTFLIPFGVQAGDIVTVTEQDGAWSNDGISWTCTDGTPFALGLCLGDKYHLPDDPDPTTRYHGELILEVAGQYLSGSGGPVTLADFTGQRQLVVAPNFSVVNGAGGTIEYKICVQSGVTPPTTDWCLLLDYRASSYGAHFDAGSWSPGVGLVSADTGSGGTESRVIEVSLNSGWLPANYLTIDLYFDLTLGSYNTESPVLIVDMNGVESPVIEYSAAHSGDGQTLSWSGDVTAPANADFFLRASRGAFEGSIVVTGAKLTGHGRPPGGLTSNC